MQLLQIVDEYIKKHPLELLSRIDFEGQTIWIKRRSPSKRTIWHRLVSVLTYLIPLAIFYPTVISDKSDNLTQEAERLRLFAAKGLPVPKVLASTANYIITSDVGLNLQQLSEQIIFREERYSLLEKAMDALINLHQTNLCHGRPFLRDMTLKNNKIFFIDLEENPLAVMNISQAQARDLWLFFSNIARHCKSDYSILPPLFQIYADSASPATMSALKQMVSILKPLRIISEYLLAPIKSKDLRYAVQANKALEKCFKRKSR
jgi:tRNA A-37 threonylcarbamoyl transferase component Bud32